MNYSNNNKVSQTYDNWRNEIQGDMKSKNFNE